MAPGAASTPGGSTAAESTVVPIEREHEVIALGGLLDELGSTRPRCPDGIFLGLVADALDREVTAGGIEAEIEISAIR